MGSCPLTHSGPRASRLAVWARWCLVLVGLVFTQGCRTYATKTESVRNAWATGQVDLALKTFSDRVQSAGAFIAQLRSQYQAARARLALA